MASKTLPQTKSELREALAHELGLPNLDRDTWERLEFDGSVEDYLLRKDRKQFNRILRRARNPDARPGRPRGRKSWQYTGSSLHPLEKSRALALSTAFGRFASGRDDVKSVRKHVLGGSVLPHDQAVHLLLQVAPRYFSLEWFRERSIPVFEHTSYWWCDEYGPCSALSATMIRIEWGRRSLAITDVRELLHLPHAKSRAMRLPDRPETIFVRNEGPGTRIGWNVEVQHENHRFCPEGIRHTWEREWRWARVADDSVLGEIQWAAANLSSDYQWSYTDAVLFLIEGLVPFVGPVSLSFNYGNSRFHHRTEVSLHLDPWVSDETVLRAFRDARRMTLKKQTKLMEQRRVWLFDFVENFRDTELAKGWDQIKKDGPPFPWKSAMAAWNEAYPGWSYSSIGRFKSAFRKTHAEMLKPHENRPDGA